MSDLPPIDKTEQHQLSLLEAALIETFRRLSNRQQPCLLELVQALASHAN